MNNDPCAYHVSFLLIAGDRDEGRRWREKYGEEIVPAQLSTAKPTQRKGGREGKMECM
jgi:hypothetical protein